MLGKIEIGLGGAIRVLKFNNYAVYSLATVLKCDAADSVNAAMRVAVENPMRAFVYIVYAGMIGFFESQANYNHGIELRHVAEWMGEADQEELMNVWNTFKDATGIPTASEETVKEYQEAVAKQNTGTEKKKED